MKFLEIEPNTTIELPVLGDLPKQVHVFDRDSIRAVNAALAARRPLLVRGEPGIGKSQLAQAVAKQLQRPYLQYVVDARTESRDLLWHYDAVARLAEAQLCGALGQRETGVRRRLSVRNFLHPGPLWWAFDWWDAERQATEVGEGTPLRETDADPHNGSVLLIDEIDKADSDVPNGLLEALGNGQFTPLGRREPVVCRPGIPLPLVIVTTNEERALPDAFLRRCLVLQLKLPAKRAELETFLTERGRRHFPTADAEVIATAVALLADQRAPADGGPPPIGPLLRPGQAEFLDLSRAVVTRRPDDPAGQLEFLEEIKQFALEKQPDAANG